MVQTPAYRDVEALDEGDAVRVALEGEVEAAEAVPRERVRAALGGWGCVMGRVIVGVVGVWGCWGWSMVDGMDGTGRVYSVARRPPPPLFRGPPL